MDIDLFMELFSRKGVENRMLPYADIRTTYHEVFAESNQFLYYLTIYSIQTHARSAFVTGRYTLVQTLRRGNKMRIVSRKYSMGPRPRGGFFKDQRDQLWEKSWR